MSGKSDSRPGPSSQDSAGMPSPTTPRAALRHRIELQLTTNRELEAFILDYFDDIYREFARGMHRTERVNLLLEVKTVEEISVRLDEFLALQSSRQTPVEKFKRATRRKIKKIYILLSIVFGAFLEFLFGPFKLIWYLAKFGGSSTGLGIVSLGVAAAGATVAVVEYKDPGFLNDLKIYVYPNHLKPDLGTADLRAKNTPSYVHMMVPPDLAVTDMTTPPDLATVDLTTPPDLAIVDLTTPPDLTIVDLAIPLDLSVGRRERGHSRRPDGGAKGPRKPRGPKEDPIDDTEDQDDVLKKFKNPIEMACSLLTKKGSQSETVVDLISSRLGNNVTKMFGTSDRDYKTILTDTLSKITGQTGEEAFIGWAENHILNESEADKLDCYKNLYARWFRDLTRVYAVTFILMKQNSTLSKFSPGTELDARDDTSLYFLECKATAASDVSNFMKISSASLFDVCQSWIRRKVIHHSEKASLRLLRKVLQTYDAGFWTKHGSQLN